MRIAVLGSGSVGRTLATGFEERDHEVVLGTRDPSSGAAAEWAAASRGGAATFADAARGADAVVLATSGQAAVAVARSLGDAADGLLVVDVTNPLDFSHGFPPVLFTGPHESLGEQVQAALPRARVVKALNTVAAAVMVEPDRLPGGSTLPIAGDDAAAKDAARALLRELGWSDDDLLDLGGLAAARATEAYVLYWVALSTATGTGDVGTRVVRAPAS
jgi:8-hydroxy-5-deazaflavin:NADPH oxidoreductase